MPMVPAAGSRSKLTSSPGLARMTTAVLMAPMRSSAIRATAAERLQINVAPILASAQSGDLRWNQNDIAHFERLSFGIVHENLG